MNRQNRTAPIRAVLLATVVCWLGHTASSAAPGNTISATVSISPESLFIGDEISIVLEVEHSDSVDIAVSGIAAALDSFELIRRDSVVTTESGGRVVHEVKLSLTTFETGELTPGPFQVFIAEDGHPDTLELAGHPIRVVSLLEPEPSDIRDIKGLVPAQGPWWPWVAGGALLLAGFFLYLVWRRRRIRAAGSFESEEIQGPPPDAWAREQLDHIERMELLSRQRVKEHYIRVTGVLRKYIGMRYGIETLERTTEEILLDLDRINLPADRMNALRELLTEGDMVKFARLIPDTADSASYIPRMRDVVERSSAESREKEVSDAVR